jgi:hypothetical protein
VSTVGVVAGFLCIRHPDLDAAQPFWVSLILTCSSYFHLDLRL